MMKPFAIRSLTAILAICLYAEAGRAGNDARAYRVSSPDDRLAVDVNLNTNGVPRYAIQRDGREVLRESRLGLVRDDADFSKGLRPASVSEAEPVEDTYEILTAKRRQNTYRANQRIFRLETASGDAMDIVFRVSNDGVAFRYVFPETSGDTRRLTEEATSFCFLDGTKAWMQPMSVAKSGWRRTNPSYEEFYSKDIPVGTPSPFGAGWVYPALFRSGDTWLLLSECGLSRDYCGTRLRSESPGGEYTVGFPDPRETVAGGPANPESTLPWQTPWRIIVVGDLSTIVESTLGIDLADPPAVEVGSPIEPGKAAWSWPLLKDDFTNFETQKRFIDYAADMGWRYCLVDALWDRQIGYDKVQELIDYARAKEVRILLWYNSAGDWNESPQTPRDRMLTHASRVKEFDRLKAMGVAGLKVDFFGGDGQSVIAYYHDILEDAAPYGFHLNFHGATLPRGWQRTYPHLLTVEAIRGLEYATFEQSNADQAPAHATMMPFTRNVFDPMDYTPMVLDQIPGSITRRTTSAFELALSVLFTSGIQHYAEIPEGMARAPAYVREFLKTVPAVWDDVRFVDGYPGRFAVVARRGGGRWYIAGVNGEADQRETTIDLTRLPVDGTATGTLITDGEGGNLSFDRRQVNLNDDRLPIAMKPLGGFVLVIE